MSSPAADIVSTLQSASLKRSPSPTHDLNPSTAASRKSPITISSPTASSAPLSPTLSTASDSTIPLPRLRPAPRRPNFPPLPDLRFEQSYLASIKEAKSNWEVTYITVKDQVLMPLAQGLLWALVVQGWRYWNRGVKVRGKGWGGKVRRWWWGVNGWKIPAEGKGS